MLKRTYQIWNDEKIEHAKFGINQFRFWLNPPERECVICRSFRINFFELGNTTGLCISRRIWSTGTNLKNVCSEEKVLNILRLCYFLTLKPLSAIRSGIFHRLRGFEPRKNSASSHCRQISCFWKMRVSSYK